jgi:hypothetical protein
VLEGLVWGFVFYFIALIIALWCYRLYSPIYQNTFSALLISWLGHYIGTYLYATVPTDSLVQFFSGASPVFRGFNTPFVLNIVWYVREYLTGDSYPATLYFFAAFAFIGSMLWYLLFLQMAQWLQIDNQRYKFPAFVLLCWPSYFFFTAGIGKDSLCFFLIPWILLAWNELTYKKRKASLILSIAFATAFVTEIRPYVFMILVGGYFISKISWRSFTGFRIIFVLILLPILFYVAHWVGTEQGMMTGIDITEVGARAARQQELLNGGTTFPMLSKNPIAVILLLPYSFLMNMIMPLFIFALNLTGMVASVENAFLVWIMYRFWKKRKIYTILKTKLESVKFCFSYFIAGMSFLGLINTNLGLATRQKSMYVPAFLVVAMLVWQYDKLNRLQLRKNAFIDAHE